MLLNFWKSSSEYNFLLYLLTFEENAFLVNLEGKFTAFSIRLDPTMVDPAAILNETIKPPITLFIPHSTVLCTENCVKSAHGYELANL